MSSFPVPGSNGRGPDYSNLPDYVRGSSVPVGLPTASVPGGPYGPYGPGRALGSAPYRPWRTATLTFLVGLAVEVTCGVVLGVVGLAALAGTDLTTTDPSSLVGAFLLVLAVVLVLRVVVQSVFLRARGGARPLLSCVLALVATLGAGVVLGAAGLVLLTPVVSRVVEIVVIATTSRPASTAPAHL